MIHLVVFDMAGTTVDDSGDAVAVGVRNALRNGGIEITPEQVNPVMGMPKPLAIRTLIKQAEGAEPTNGRVAELHEQFRAEMVRYYSEHPSVREVEGASELFEWLRSKNIRVTLDTGFDRTILDAIVNRLGWADLLDETVGSNEVENGRPAPDMIHELMRRTGVSEPSSVCKIGDSESDIEQGVAAECGMVIAIENDRTREMAANTPGVISARTLADVKNAIAASLENVPA